MRLSKVFFSIRCGPQKKFLKKLARDLQKAVDLCTNKTVTSVFEKIKSETLTRPIKTKIIMHL